MAEHVLIGLASIMVLGISAQWLAWKFHLPAILLLLVFGFVAGPVTGVLQPDKLFGELLFPLVSILLFVATGLSSFVLPLEFLNRLYLKHARIYLIQPL